jgi:hypothetical protein
MSVGLVAYLFLLATFTMSNWVIPCEGWPVDVMMIKDWTSIFILYTAAAYWAVAFVAGLLTVPLGLKVRFHLPTLVLATALLGSLIGMNVRLKWVYCFSLPCYAYGWPVPFYFYGGRGVSGKPVGLEAETFVIDVLLWALIVLLPILLCESWCRKRSGAVGISPDAQTPPPSLKGTARNS